MTLKNWLELEKIGIREFGRRARLSPQMVDNYCQGKNVPRLRAMMAIYRTTGGAVRPADFYPAKAGGTGR